MRSAPLQRGGLSDGLIFDATRIRMLEIAEAVKALPRRLACHPAVCLPPSRLPATQPSFEVS